MKKSQNDKVLEYLQEHDGMTTLDAFQKLGISRLSARIKDLRTAGHVIFSDPIEVENRFGDMCRVTQYRLIKEAKT